ncbi:MAG: hypothetical protein AB7N24_17970 [Dehalococcoidia bacterium]
MNPSNFLRKTALASFAVVAIGAGSQASFGHSYAAESTGTGGTADINIGVGELQECTISKSMDATNSSDASMTLYVRGRVTGWF